MTVDGVTETNVPLVSYLNNVYFGDQLIEALPEADVVIMAAPLTVRTKNILGRQEFLAMKKNSYLINVSRGGTIDLEAIVNELYNGRFAAVGLDVTNPEPLPSNHPIRQFERVIITPHVAGTSDNLRARNFELITANIRRFMLGYTLINEVDKRNGF